MKKYQLTDDVGQYRKYWMTKIMAHPAQRDCQEMWEKGENLPPEFIAQTNAKISAPSQIRGGLRGGGRRCFFKRISDVIAVII